MDWYNILALRYVSTEWEKSIQTSVDISILLLFQTLNHLKMKTTTTTIIWLTLQVSLTPQSSIFTISVHHVSQKPHVRSMFIYTCVEQTIENLLHEVLFDWLWVCMFTFVFLFLRSSYICLTEGYTWTRHGRWCLNVSN